MGTSPTEQSPIKADVPAEGPNSVQTKIPGRLADPNPELEELSGAFSPVDLTGEEATDVL